MTDIQIDERVELVQDIPEFGLHRGEFGRVCSTWFGSLKAYEVEFMRETPDCSIRVILMLSQIRSNSTLPA